MRVPLPRERNQPTHSPYHWCDFAFVARQRITAGDTAGEVGLLALLPRQIVETPATQRTAVVMLVFNRLVDIGTAGVDAEAVQQIKEVIADEMKLPDDRSFGEAIIDIEKNQTAIGTKVDLLVGRAAAIALEDEEG